MTQTLTNSLDLDTLIKINSDNFNFNGQIKQKPVERTAHSEHTNGKPFHEISNHKTPNGTTAKSTTVNETKSNDIESSNGSRSSTPSN